MAFLGIGKKRKAPQYEFKPYGGLRPPRIDYTDASGKPVEILRPTQKQIFDLLMAGSRGEGVGYSPERKTAALALLGSQIEKQREDDVRTAQGRVASSGLSGNLRAQEALTGRVNRDAARSLAEQTNLLNIEDLGVQQREREADKRALQELNRTNFGQENAAADFDLSVYGAENASRQASAANALAGYQIDTGSRDKFLEGAFDLGGTVLGASMGGPVGGTVGGQAARALAGGGKGLAPNVDYMNPMSGWNRLQKSLRYTTR